MCACVSGCVCKRMCIRGMCVRLCVPDILFMCVFVRVRACVCDKRVCERV